MTEEEKAKLEAEEAEAKANAQDEESAKDDESEEEDKSNKSSDKIDYETELAKEREAREKAEKAAADTAFKLREAKRQNKDEDYDDDEEKPLTAKELQSILANERQATQKALQEQRIGEIASKLTTSEAERNLVIEIHKNRQFPSHLSLEDQLEEAFVIANRKKLIGERNEALRALKAKGSANDNPSGTYHEAPKAGEPKMASADIASLKAIGYAWNGRVFEKKLKNGVLQYDPKTKKTTLIKS